ncbi:hypothetical protein BH18GEM1_BH18GEM1_22440 [soil metagenome]
MDTTTERVRLLRLADVVRLTALSKSAIHRRRQEATFPAPVDTGFGTPRWREDDVRRWIDSLPHLHGYDESS